MIYIVSGFVRSGTSMMMEALSAGGLQCEWSKERDDAMNRKNADEDYSPNESYFEIKLKEYNNFDFPLKYDGSLIKIMSWGLNQMRRTEGFRCVFMMRDAYEIAESHTRAFSDDLMVVENGMRVPANESKSWPSRYEQEMKTAIIGAETRIDCLSLHVFCYHEVIADPSKHFSRLADSGWEINPELATDRVKPERKRVSCQ